MTTAPQHLSMGLTGAPSPRTSGEPRRGEKEVPNTAGPQGAPFLEAASRKHPIVGPTEETSPPRPISLSAPRPPTPKGRLSSRRRTVTTFPSSEKGGGRFHPTPVRLAGLPPPTAPRPPPHPCPPLPLTELTRGAAPYLPGVTRRLREAPRGPAAAGAAAARPGGWRSPSACLSLRPSAAPPSPPRAGANPPLPPQETRPRFSRQRLIRRYSRRPMAEAPHYITRAGAVGRD